MIIYPQGSKVFGMGRNLGRFGALPRKAAGGGSGPVITQADVLAWADFENNLNQRAAGTGWTIYTDESLSWQWDFAAGVNGQAHQGRRQLWHRKTDGLPEVANGGTFSMWCMANGSRSDSQGVGVANYASLRDRRTFAYNFTRLNSGQFQVRNAAGSITYVNASAFWSDTWHMVTISWGDGQALLWVDTTLRATVPWDGTWWSPSGNTIAAGIEQGGGTSTPDQLHFLDSMVLLNKRADQAMVDFLYAAGAGRNYGEIPA